MVLRRRNLERPC